MNAPATPVTPAATAHTLSSDRLHPALTDPALASMNLLNEVAHRFPDAISFAPRPTGAARLVDMPIRPVAGGTTGIDCADLLAQLRLAEAEGLRPRACYLVPDFANPSGASIALADRRRLLDIAEEHGILLLEDNPYGLFHGHQSRLPTLKSLDRGATVVYLGSFAKTVLPGARVGYAVADQPVRDETTGRTEPFAAHLSKIKSMLTVNTSPSEGLRARGLVAVA